MPERLTSAQAAARLHARDTLGIPLATGQPGGLVDALGARQDWSDLRVSGGLLLVGPDLFQHPGVHYLSGFFGPIERALRDQGANISFVPAGFRQFAPLLDAVRPRVMATMAAPPDADGNCSLSLHAGGTITELRAAGADPDRLLVVEVSEAFPITQGIAPEYPHVLHLDEIDLLVESDHAPFELPEPQAGETERAIAGHAAQYIPEGATLQTGIGSIPSHIVAMLAEGGSGGYGIHTEMLTDGIMALHEAGKVTNEKGSFDGRSVATFALGTSALYDWLREDETVAFLPVETVNSPEVIGSNRRMITVNGAMAVDIHGQVMADTIDGAQHSGIGGHEDFVAGTALSNEDRALICLPSTVTVDGQVRSRIVPFFDAGSVITTPRHQVDAIVTEYGAAELQGLTIRQRGESLAAIAHPDFRDDLLAAAQRASGGRSPRP